jgi:hypothetical protein
MGTLTLRRLRTLTGERYLKSDLSIYFYSWYGLTCVRSAERATERKYPIHRLLRKAAATYFAKSGYHVYPNGVGPSNVSACADLALIPCETLKGRKPQIIFVECLRAHFMDPETLQKKRRLEAAGQLYFVIEYKSPNDFESRRDWRQFRTSVRRLARTNRTYWCRCENGVGRIRAARPRS